MRTGTLVLVLVLRRPRYYLRVRHALWIVRYLHPLRGGPSVRAEAIESREPVVRNGRIVLYGHGVERDYTLTPEVPSYVFEPERDRLTSGIAKRVPYPGPGDIVSNSKEARVDLVLQRHDAVEVLAGAVGGSGVAEGTIRLSAAVAEEVRVGPRYA
jgi:hypothetical protein